MDLSLACLRRLQISNSLSPCFIFTCPARGMSLVSIYALLIESVLFSLIPRAQLVSLTVVPSGSERFLSVCFPFFLSSFLCTLFRPVLYTPVSASSACFMKRRFCQIHPRLLLPPSASLWFSHRKLLCVEQTTCIFISPRPTGLPGGQPSASRGAAA